MKPRGIASILVVDDHADTRGLVSELLRAEGYTVVEAENGEQALELLRAETESEPCLILLDLEMPVLTGWELLVLLRSCQRLARIPVLVTSGSVARSDELTQAPVVGFIRKPYDLDELLARIAAIARP